MTKKFPRLIPLAKWNEYHPYPTVPALRNLAFTKPSGFEKVVIRVNGRVLVNEAAWFKWVDQQAAESEVNNEKSG